MTAAVSSIVLTGGEYEIAVSAGDATLRFTFAAEPPGDHTQESWVSACCREALCLAEAQTAPQPAPVDVPIPPEFQHGG